MFKESCANNKVIFVKIISVFIIIAFVFGIIPTSGLSQIITTAKAEQLPQYNPAYGSFTKSTVNGNTVLTATAKEGCGFRGWYYKDGTEVSYKDSYTVPAGNNAEDYIPVFYNFNLIKNGGFEEYAVGTDMKSVTDGEAWDGYPDSEPAGKGDWTSMKIVSDRARTGNNSLKIQSQANTAYRIFENLEQNTQYTLKFYYNIDVPTETSNNYLSRITVIPGDDDIPVRNEMNNKRYLARKSFTTTTGACAEGEWKEVSLTFYSNENTTVKFYLLYGSGTNSAIYVDDMTLTKDTLAAPTYINDDFTSGKESIYISDPNNLEVLADSTTGYRLKVISKNTYKHIQLNPIKVKKGCNYTIKFNLDFSEVTDYYVPKTEGGKIVTDENGAIVYNKTEANWINFAISDAYSIYGGTYYNNSDDSTDKTYNYTVTDSNGKKLTGPGRNYSSVGFGSSTLSSFSSKKSLTVTIPFTAHRDSEVYFNIRLNGLGTYYIDNFQVTENTDGFNKTDFALNEAIDSLGTAIRTTGRQGMRHKTKIEKSLLSSNMYYGLRVIEYGTVAVKTEYLGGKDLVLNGSYNYNGTTYTAKKGVAYSASDGIDFIYSEDDKSIDFTGVLMNIDNSNWNSDYTARAYFKYVDASGKIGTLYANPFDIAVYPLAKEAYSAKKSNGDFVESDEVRELLYKKIIRRFTDKVIKVSDASAPIATNFQGIRSTVYHATTFFPSAHGRTYTEEQAAVEMDRLVDTKVDNVRTRFASQWMWNDETGWDWNSTKMQAFYKWAKMLQDRDISITLNASWHLQDFVYYYDYNKNGNANAYSSNGHSSIPEVNYLHGEGEAFYGEDSNSDAIKAAAEKVGLNLTDAELLHYSVAAVRYGEWIKQALNALKANGVNNVEYILPFTETGYKMADDPTYCYDEWIIMVMGLNDTLASAGIRNNYKIIGPSQNIYKGQNRISLMEYMYNDVINGTDYEDMLDINAMHQYAKPNVNLGYETDYENSVYDPEASYSFCETNFPYFKGIVESTGNSDKEFWCDEYFANAPDVEYIDGNGMQMIQFAAGITSGINNGVNRFVSWQMFDCLWENTATHSYGEFLGGVHICGTCPSLIKVDGKACTIVNCPCNAYNLSSYTPRNTYYGINLLGKLMNNKSSNVYKTEVANDATNDGGIYVSAINNDEGNTVILVVNTTHTVMNVDIQLEKTSHKTFNRYIYDPDEVEPTPEAKSIGSDKKIIVDEQNSIFDMIPSRSFAIYASDSYGLDVDLPLDVLG